MLNLKNILMAVSTSATHRTRSCFHNQDCFARKYMMPPQQIGWHAGTHVDEKDHDSTERYL
jgi:hypothetical protein